ncbi:hypothetical protein FrEUN1fDRAFT_5359 [Parafrankia sp. EUN1f]|nr:hypothetical protein FrEUN1fDRAFT_5359 [Parafrankia sp. EUN1f]
MMDVGSAARTAGRRGPAFDGSTAAGAAQPADPRQAAADPRAGEERRFQVFDGDGQFVGVFGNWEAAHAWGHRRAAEPLARLPIRIEDQLDRRTWTVEPGLCQLVVGRRQNDHEPPTYVPGAESSAPVAGAPPASATSGTAVSPGAWSTRAAAGQPGRLVPGGGAGH